MTNSEKFAEAQRDYVINLCERGLNKMDSGEAMKFKVGSSLVDQLNKRGKENIMENKKFNLIISKDENGNLIKKFAPYDENHQVECFQYGDYLLVDESDIQNAKEKLLEQMFNTIKDVAKDDRFWIVKPVEGSKCTVGWKIDFPQMYSK